MIRINLLLTKKPVKVPPVFVYGSIGIIALIVALIAVTFFLNKKVSDMQAEVSVKEARLKELKAAIVEVQNYEKDNKELIDKTKIIEILKKDQAVPLRLLDEVSDKLPKGVWLTVLSDKNRLINIEGYAFTNYDLVGYVQGLKESKYLTDVTLIESRQTAIDTFPLYKFKLTFRIKV
jgi:type IV pilus assembly protein PilN